MLGYFNAKSDLRRPKFLYAESGQPLTHVNARLQGLTLDETSQEAASESITSTVAVNDLGSINSVDGELLDFVLALDSDKSSICALGNNGNTLAFVVLLWEVGQMLDDVLGLLGGEAVGLSVRGGLGLVTNDVVPKGGAGIDDLLKKLGDEGGGQRENERLVVFSGLLGQLHYGRGAD